MNALDKIGFDDLCQIPFFKNAIESTFLNFDVKSYLKNLHKGINKDRNTLTKLLIEKSIKSYSKDITISALYLNLAKAMQNCYVPGIKEFDEDPGFIQMIDWSKKFYPEFNDEYEADSFEYFIIGEHVYYTIKQLEKEKSNDVKIALCLGLYLLMRICAQASHEKYEKEAAEFPRFLQIKRLMKPDIHIVFDETDVLAVGILNNREKYEFFQVTQFIQPPEAMEERLMTEKEYYENYCIDDEEFDYPLFVYGKNVIEGEFDDYKLFVSERDYHAVEELVFLTVLKDNIWKVYQLSKYEDHVEKTHSKFLGIDVEEMEEMRGLDFYEIETEINSIFEDL